VLATRPLMITSSLLLLLPAAARGQNQCRFYLANHSDGNSGLILSLETSAGSSGNCQLGSLNLRLTVGDGSALHHVDAAFSWQTGVVYTAKAVITAAGPQQLSINGQSVGSVQGTFKSSQATFSASLVDDSGTVTEGYMVSEISLQVSNGANTLTLAPNGNNPVPIQLILLAGGPAPWQTSFNENAVQQTR